MKNLPAWRRDPRVATRHSDIGRHADCTCYVQEKPDMYYGIGGTILIVLLVLFFLGRL